MKDGLVSKTDAIINMTSNHYCGIKYASDITTTTPEATTKTTDTFEWNDFSWYQNCYFGNLSWQLNVSNYLECYEACLNTSNCSIFHFNSTQKTCTLHDSDQTQIFPQVVNDNQQICGYTCKLKFFPELLKIDFYNQIN